MAPISAGDYRVLVGRNTGELVAELEVEIGNITWRLNDVGRVSFAISKRDNKALREVLDFGNRILVEFTNGLPPWGGIIDVPRSWDGDTIVITAYSMEYTLSQRITEKTATYTGVVAGGIFEDLLAKTNSAHDTGIIIGDVWYGGTDYTVEYHYQDILSIIREDLSSSHTEENVGPDFDVVPSVVDNAIQFAANFYERKGTRKTGLALMEAHNLVGIRLLEQGPIINSWSLAGAGVDWSTARITSEQSNADSIALYGLRQKGQVYGNVTTVSVLDETAINLVTEGKDPHVMLELEAIDLAPATYASYDVGDSIKVMLHSYGFDGYDQYVHIIAREFNPATGVCRLIVREDLS